FIGEVGLLGEVRKSYQEEKIIQESKRLMFKNIYSSKNTHTIKQIREIIV
ncbi:DNA repair protein RadA, partial [Candidatus Roizmanbacteria bacterium CG_4_10_14_0_8_um_filter_39_9]